MVLLRLEIRGVEKLSFRERQVVILKEMGLGNEEIGRRLQLSPASVATLYRRARTKGYEVVVVLPGDRLGLLEEGVEEPDG